jgi:hypothetical protein
LVLFIEEKFLLFVLKKRCGNSMYYWVFREYLGDGNLYSCAFLLISFWKDLWSNLTDLI